MPSTPTAQEFLMGGGVASAAFPSIGTKHSGTICEEPTVQQQRDLATSELKWWADGGPMNQLVVTVQTDERDPAIDDDDGRRRFYIKANLRNAIADAVKKSGAKGLDIGGTLTVQYTGDGVASTRGFSAPKLYAAAYLPPTAVAAQGFISTPEPSAAVTSNGASAALAPTSWTPEQIAAMVAAGVDPTKLATV